MSEAASSLARLWFGIRQSMRRLSCFRGVGVRQWRNLVSETNALEPQTRALSDEELRRSTLSLGHRARRERSEEGVLIQAYALVREAARRTIGLRHFDVQLLGGIALYHGCLAEIHTGEGKTLTATLVAYLRSLAGRGCHVVTFNDYLAQRDSEWMGPVYRALGLSVGVVLPSMERAQRREAYACDVTYTTVRELGFDFLWDRLWSRASLEAGGHVGRSGESAKEDPMPVQREPYFAVVDEADSILLDYACDPMYIGTSAADDERTQVDCYRWSAAICSRFTEGEDYRYEFESRRVQLTAHGRRKVRDLPKPESLDPIGMVVLYEHVERAIKVQLEFHRDRQYIIQKERVVIVEEATGRPGKGRVWSGGIHQAVQAKESLEITLKTDRAASVSVQSLLRRYRHLAGITGTVMNSAGEFRRVYGCRTICIPTHRPNVRTVLPELIFGTASAKWAAVVEEIRQMHVLGRPVLVGTRSIDKSNRLSRLLTEHGIPHQVLNAYRLKDEASIVAIAGMRGKVTVATNMAGRGTDIKLDEAKYYEHLGKRENNCPLHHYLPVFRKTQERCERSNRRRRRRLLYGEQQRVKKCQHMGLDPYLDVPAE